MNQIGNFPDFYTNKDEHESAEFDPTCVCDFLDELN